MKQDSDIFSNVQNQTLAPIDRISGSFLLWLKSDLERHFKEKVILIDLITETNGLMDVYLESGDVITIDEQDFFVLFRARDISLC